MHCLSLAEADFAVPVQWSGRCQGPGIRLNCRRYGAAKSRYSNGSAGLERHGALSNRIARQ